MRTLTAGIVPFVPFERRIWHRAGLWAIGGGLLIGALSLSKRTDMFYVGWFWPIWFALGGILMIAFALRPSSRRLYIAAGAFTIAAFLSNLARVIGDPIADGTMGTRFWGVVFLATMGSLLTAFFWVIWWKYVDPWQIVQQARRDVRRDAS